MYIFLLLKSRNLRRSDANIGMASSRLYGSKLLYGENIFHITAKTLFVIRKIEGDICIMVALCLFHFWLDSNGLIARCCNIDLSNDYHKTVVKRVDNF